MDVISPSLCPKQYDMHSPFKWWRRKKRKLSCNKLPQNNLPIIRYLMVLQGPTVGEKCFDAWNLNINMMCRQYTPSLFLIRVMFQKNNFFPRKATVNAVVVYGPWTFALRVLRVPGDCPVKQSEPETVAEKGAKEKKNWASFVKTAVLFACSIKPSCDGTTTKSGKSETISTYDFAYSRMSSAKRRSRNAGWPSSPTSNPFNRASRVQPFSPLQHGEEQTKT